MIHAPIDIDSHMGKRVLLLQSAILLSLFGLMHVGEIPITYRYYYYDT